LPSPQETAPRSTTIVGFGGWLDFKFLFAGANLSGENRIYAVVA
jgi:hypothetical protein